MQLDDSNVVKTQKVLEQYRKGLLTDADLLTEIFRIHDNRFYKIVETADSLLIREMLAVPPHPSYR